MQYEVKLTPQAVEQIQETVSYISHTNLVFTKKEYHHQGIATAIFHYLLENLRKNDPALKEITLNASPYGKGFYLHLGFVPLSEEQEVDGIRFTPMKYVVR